MKKAILFAAAFALLGAASAQAAGKPKRYDGTINSIEGRKLHMTLRDGSTGDWTVGDNVPVTFGKKKMTLEEVKPGFRAAVWVSEDGVIREFKVVAEPAGGKKSGPKAPMSRPAKVPAKGPMKIGRAPKAAKQSPRMETYDPGVVDELDTQRHLLVLKLPKGMKRFKIDAHTAIENKGKPGSMGDVHAGQTVRVSDFRKGVVGKISIE